MNDFTALIDELAAWREHRDAQDAARALTARHQVEFSKALPPAYRASPRVTVPFDAFPAARRMADQRAARASIAGTTRELAALERATRAMAAEAAGEKRARIRAQVRDVLDRAMQGLASGNLTAIEVARIEAECGRVLARLEPGPAMMRGAA